MDARSRNEGRGLATDVQYAAPLEHVDDLVVAVEVVRGANDGDIADELRCRRAPEVGRGEQPELAARGRRATLDRVDRHHRVRPAVGRERVADEYREHPEAVRVVDLPGRSPGDERRRSSSELGR